MDKPKQQSEETKRMAFKEEDEEEPQSQSDSEDEYSHESENEYWHPGCNDAVLSSFPGAWYWIKCNDTSGYIGKDTDFAWKSFLKKKSDGYRQSDYLKFRRLYEIYQCHPEAEAAVKRICQEEDGNLLENLTQLLSLSTATTNLT